MELLNPFTAADLIVADHMRDRFLDDLNHMIWQAKVLNRGVLTRLMYRALVRARTARCA